MYRCPHCGERSISGLIHLSPRYDGRIECPLCYGAVRVTRKPAILLVPGYLVLRALAAFVLPPELQPSDFGDMILIMMVGIIQIAWVKYEAAPDDPQPHHRWPPKR